MACKYIFTALILVALAAGNAYAQPRNSTSDALSWRRLNAQQRTALAPLSGEWANMSEFRKQKWLGIARQYARRNPVQQARMQDRMREWVMLTPAQREIVRNQFKILQSVPSETRNELGRKWQEYSALPPEEKQRLAESAPRNKVTAIPTEAIRYKHFSMSPYSAIAPKALRQKPPGGGSRPLGSHPH